MYLQVQVWDRVGNDARRTGINTAVLETEGREEEEGKMLVCFHLPFLN